MSSVPAHALTDPAPDPAPLRGPEPGADRAAQPPLAAVPDETTSEPAVGRVIPRGASPAFSYLSTERAPYYRELMGVLLENKRRFGLRLDPPAISTLLWAGYSSRYETDEALERDLESLTGWEAVDHQRDNSRASSTAEFKRKRFTYDITAAGEIAERAALAVDRIAERIGALRSSQLPELLEALNTLALECERVEPRAGKLVAGFNDIAAKLERLRDDTGSFMRDLGLVMSNDEAIEAEPFELYKRRVIDHLQGFRQALIRLDPQFIAAIERVEAVGTEQIIAIAAESDEPPVWGLSDDEVASRRAGRLGAEWTGVRRWFCGADGEPPPWRDLDLALANAIEWIIAAAQRLIDRRSRRVDRSAEYRTLALLFDRAESVDDCHALYTACFGLYPPRHFSVPEEDSELTAPTASWWDGARAPVEPSFLRPGLRTRTGGRIARLPDHSPAREALAARRRRERVELERALRRFASRGRFRLRELGSLDPLEFHHLMAWLGRTLDARASSDGVRRAESLDGLVRISLRSPTRGGEPVEITTPSGTLVAPDYEVEVEAA